MLDRANDRLPSCSTLLGIKTPIRPPTRPEHTAADDWSGLGHLVSLTVQRLTDPVEGMHRAISDRWFRLGGNQIQPVAWVYQTVTAGIYGSVRGAGSALGSALSVGAAVVQRTRPVPLLWRSGPGSRVQAVANGVWGDRFVGMESPLSIEMAFRGRHGDPIVLDPAADHSSVERPKRRLAVLIHGLAETEAIWRISTLPDTEDSGLAAALTEDGFTPLLLRYNSGRSVSENGQALAALLDQVMASWPVPIEEIALVGNSMGGLVARSAMQAGQVARLGWPAAVQRLVAVGSPHLGSPLEKLAAGASRALRFAPETRPLSHFLESRSQGIKDLRSGAINDDEVRAARSVEHFVSSQPAGVEHLFIAGVVTADVDHPVGMMLGDLIVRAKSATGRGRSRSVEAKEAVVLGGRRHFDLAGDPDVISQVRKWLSPDPHPADAEAT